MTERRKFAALLLAAVLMAAVFLFLSRIENDRSCRPAANPAASGPSAAVQQQAPVPAAAELDPAAHPGAGLRPADRFGRIRPAEFGLPSGQAGKGGTSGEASSSVSRQSPGRAGSAGLIGAAGSLGGTGGVQGGDGRASGRAGRIGRYPAGPGDSEAFRTGGSPVGQPTVAGLGRSGSGSRDGRGTGIDFRPVQVVYAGTNPPVVSAVSPAQTPVVIADGRPAGFSADCWEPQSGDLSYEWKIDGRTAAAAGSWLNYAPAKGDPAVHTVTMTVESAAGGSASASWQVLNAGAPMAPAQAAACPPIVQGHVQAVAVDASGNRYLAGYFVGTNVDFNPGAASSLKSSAGLKDAFVTRFNADGTYAWTQTFGGTADDIAYGVVVSGTTVYVTGSFASSDATLGGAGTPIASAGLTDCFVLALNASTGAAVTAFSTDGVQTFGGTGNDEGRALVVSGTTLYVVGTFDSTDAGVGAAGTIASVGLTDCFVLALKTADGTALTTFSTDGVQTFGGTGNDTGRALAVSGTTLYVTGSFSGSDAGVGAAGTIAAVGLTDCFVLALKTSDGTAVTAFSTDGVQTFGGSGDEVGNALAVSGTTVYVAGTFSSANAGVGGAGAIASQGLEDAFVLALNATTGAAKTTFSTDGVQTFGGTASDLATGVAVSSGVVYVGGSFFSSNAGVGAIGTISTASAGTFYDAFALALDATTGAVKTNFNTTGVETFGGTLGGDTLGYGIAVSGGVVYLAGTSAATNARLDAAGASYDFTGWDGFLLPLIPDATTSGPVIQGHAEAVAADSLGNRYVAGYFSGTVDFNPGAGLDRRSSSGGADAFVTRFNSDGTYAWTQTFGGTGDDVAYGLAVSGTTVYVTGAFNSLDAGLGGLGSIATQGGKDAFVLALDSTTGAAVLAFSGDGLQTFGGTGDDEGAAVVVSGTTVYVTGTFASSNAGVGGTGGIASQGGKDAFVLALDFTGAAVTTFSADGVQTFGGTGDDYGYGLTVYNGTVYVTGALGSTDAGVGGAGTVTKVAGSTVNAFVLALNAATGAAKTTFSADGVQTFGGSDTDYGSGVVASHGVVYLAGAFSSGDAGVGGVGAFSPIVPNVPDAYVLALDADSGGLVPGFGGGGLQKFGGGGNDFAESIACAGDTLYVAGYFDSVNAGVGGIGTIATAGGSDAFVLALDRYWGTAVSFGALQAHTFGGTSNDAARGVAVYGSRVLVCGEFASTDARLDGTGSVYDATGWSGFLLSLATPGSSSGGGAGHGGGGCSLASGPVAINQAAGSLLPYLLLAGAWLGRRMLRGRRKA